MKLRNIARVIVSVSWHVKFDFLFYNYAHANFSFIAMNIVSFHSSPKPHSTACTLDALVLVPVSVPQMPPKAGRIVNVETAKASLRQLCGEGAQAGFAVNLQSHSMVVDEGASTFVRLEDKIVLSAKSKYTVTVDVDAAKPQDVSDLHVRRVAFARSWSKLVEIQLRAIACCASQVLHMSRVPFRKQIKGKVLSVEQGKALDSGAVVVRDLPILIRDCPQELAHTLYRRDVGRYEGNEPVVSLTVQRCLVTAAAPKCWFLVQGIVFAMDGTEQVVWLKSEYADIDLATVEVLGMEVHIPRDQLNNAVQPGHMAFQTAVQVPDMSNDDKCMRQAVVSLMRSNAMSINKERTVADVLQGFCSHILQLQQTSDVNPGGSEWQLFNACHAYLQQQDDLKMAAWNAASAALQSEGELKNPYGQRQPERHSHGYAYD